MARVVVLPKARIDIDAIWDYIAQDSEVQADLFVRRLTDKFTLLAHQPELGRPRGELLAGLRSFPFERYVIFYLANLNEIDIVRVLHSARDVEIQFHSKGQ